MAASRLGKDCLSQDTRKGHFRPESKNSLFSFWPVHPWLGDETTGDAHFLVSFPKTAHRNSWAGELLKFVPYGDTLCLVLMQSKDQLIYCFPEEPMDFAMLPQRS